LHPGPAQVIAVGIDPPLLEFHLAAHPRHHVSNRERDTRVIGVNCPLHDSDLPGFLDCCVSNIIQCNKVMGQNIPVGSELKPSELRAWRAFLDAQATLLRRLEAELVAGEGMTLAEFDVLAQLWVARDGRLRMTELAERVRLSRSGITRLVDRLVRAGLVKRGNCATDRRGTWAVLTPAGNARLRRARPLHLRGV